MSIFILIDEQTREILPDRIRGMYTAQRRAEELCEASDPNKPRTLLVCQVQNRIGTEVSVRSVAETYPEMIFGEPEFDPVAPQAPAPISGAACPAGPAGACEPSVEDLR